MTTTADLPRTQSGRSTGSPATPPRGIALADSATVAEGTIDVVGPIAPGDEEILTPQALEFLALLHDHFADTRCELLLSRQRRTRQIADGTDPDFLPTTRPVRHDPSWRVAGSTGAPGLSDRRVEITGPTDPKMTINALNSGAKVWLADAEDASSPTWANVIGGQRALRSAIRGELSFDGPSPDGGRTPGKHYALRTSELTEMPTIVFRPRGWHLFESHLAYTGTDGSTQPASGSLVDFGLYFFHNARELITRGRGPYFYLPKLESHREARLWNEVFELAQHALDIPRGTVRATVLIETLPAAFEMEEILYELRDHCAGLNAGRWDYLFSVIKCFRSRGDSYVLPDRAQVTMTAPFMRAYTELLVATCHRRGAHAIGGMSAFIPDRRNPEVTEQAFAKVRADKEREAGDGFDGSWVAHPDLIPIAREAFDAVLGERENQVDRQRDDVTVGQAELLDIASARREGATITESGLRTNISVGVRYIASWLRGTGAAALDNLMEDAATAEISRSQIWQWMHSGTRTEDGTVITRERCESMLQEFLRTTPRTPGDRLDEAVTIFREVSLGDEFPPFLTTSAYARYFS
ncbi:MULTISPECIES: malate synthase A [unclassified Isoptericola]|uniref:malate synthase A n=1 Tax=unclassified Isoptericola TaxID=2623355 RepID=UPI002712E94A|nr:MULTISPECIES: malate synthase A [unclassified Isoptericola]MDO8144255.1 malate synthase A [Isoptericola sp. 178]MDO8148109.1 malate synthase A [Isoptericola sp. b515]